jgi:heme/copper-type cytochrome/quinol oxidase subunit 2
MLYSFLPLVAQAAADQDVLDVASTTANALKDNILGVLSANIGTILTVGISVLAIYFIWRFGKRMIGGR